MNDLIAVLATECLIFLENFTYFLPSKIPKFQACCSTVLLIVNYNPAYNSMRKHRNYMFNFLEQFHLSSAMRNNEITDLVNILYLVITLNYNK